MKVNEIRELTPDELALKLSELKAELFNLRFQNATNQLDNPLKIADVKKSIARVKTIIRERELS
jgi:large subunit ribosomal protein L29